MPKTTDTSTGGAEGGDETVTASGANDTTDTSTGGAEGGPEGGEGGGDSGDGEGESGPKPIPAKVRLVAPHGFIDEETGENRFWRAGTEVTDPEEVALLMKRRAPYESVD